MDLFIFFIPFLLFCFMVAKILTKSQGTKHSTLKLPPGPKPLPIIGNMHQFLGTPILIHHLLTDLAKIHGPLMHLKLGQHSAIVVTSPEMAKEIYKTQDLLFASRPSHLSLRIVSYNFIDIIFSPHGNHWRQLRKICTMELLSPKRVQTFRSVREDEVLKLIKSISSEKGGIINLTRAIFSLIYSITSRAAFGKRSQHTEKYIELVEQINHLGSGFCVADMYPSVKLLQMMIPMRYKLERAQKRIDEIAKNILSEHKEKLRETRREDGEEANEDLVDVLLNIQQKGEFQPQLTDTCIKAVIADIFTAGGETSSAAVDWAFSEMIKSPEIMKRAQDEVRNVFAKEGNVDESRLQELKYLHAIVKETLRLHPSAPLLLPRKCDQTCEISGYDIPKNATIIVNAWAMGRDPKYWSEAQKFYPERFLNSEVDYKGNDFEYIPFGAGRRICPGIWYSQPIIELLLAQLLFHFDWELRDGLKHEELEMNENFGVIMRRQNDLQLIPTLYQGSSLNKEN